MILTSAIFPVENQAFARCPNGTHVSPSGDCETVVAHTGLTKCANGSHRSPDGICEQVVSKNFNGNNNVSTLNIAENPFINGTNSNNISHTFANSTNATNMMVQSSNAPQWTVSPLAINHTLDQYCDQPRHPSCYGVGFKAGRSAPGTNCPISYSFAFCEGYHVGSGMGIVNRGTTGGETDVGDAISFYLHHFPHSINMSKTPNTITTISGKLELPTTSNTTLTANTTTETKAPSVVPSKNPG